jgi:hypothetical protein
MLHEINKHSFIQTFIHYRHTSRKTPSSRHRLQVHPADARDLNQVISLHLVIAIYVIICILNKYVIIMYIKQVL